MDIATSLEDYLEDLEEITITLDGGASKVNFAEAALLIQVLHDTATIPGMVSREVASTFSVTREGTASCRWLFTILSKIVQDRDRSWLV